MGWTTLVRDGEAFVDTDTYTTLEAMQAKYPGKDRGALLLALKLTGQRATLCRTCLRRERAQFESF